MNVEEKRRELFEAWWSTRRGVGSAPVRYAGGQYVSDSALWAWIGFNAALDAVVIQMPADFDCYDGGQTMEDCIAAIESTGLGIKVLP